MRSLTLALDQHRRGLWPFPVHPERRSPLVKWGHIDTYGFPEHRNELHARLHVGEKLPYSTWLFHWFSDLWPSAGIGIMTGRSRLIVLDVDPRSGGIQSLRELCDTIELPATYTVRTRGGGIHLYYRTPHLVRSRVAALGPGLDVKSAGGVVIAPGTPGYVVEDRRPIAEAPEVLLEILPKAGHRQPELIERVPMEEARRAIEHAIGRIRDSGPGTRHDTTYGMARWLFDICAEPELDGLLYRAAIEGADPNYHRNYARAIADARRKAGA